MKLLTFPTKLLHATGGMACLSILGNAVQLEWDRLRELRSGHLRLDEIRLFVRFRRIRLDRLKLGERR